MLGIYNYTVILTYMSVISAITGIGLCITGAASPAFCCILLAFSGICDTFDGMVARTKKDRTQSEKNFGIQIDSLADISAFGFFPAAIGIYVCKAKAMLLAFLGGAVLVLAALIRLAHFNVTEEERQRVEGGKRKFYEGLPVTASCVVFPLTVWIAAGCHKDPAYMYVFFLFLLSLMFVSKMKVPKPGAVSALEILYETGFGRLVLKLLTRPGISKICGAYMDSALSKTMIRRFIRKNAIDMDEYEEREFKSFNDFFCRKIKEGYRKNDPAQEHLICPCDGHLTAHEIHDGLVLPVKQSEYSIAELLKDENLAAEYEGGTALVFRLGVENYHRYAFVDEGVILAQKRIPGILHTVRPVALYERPVFLENTREYVVADTKNFGQMIQMEVGALLVGRICNESVKDFHRGEEKGHFEYGGSTIILLLKKNAVRIREEILACTSEDGETSVRMGQCIGEKQ